MAGFGRDRTAQRFDSISGQHDRIAISTDLHIPIEILSILKNPVNPVQFFPGSKSNPFLTG